MNVSFCIFTPKPKPGGIMPFLFPFALGAAAAVAASKMFKTGVSSVQDRFDTLKNDPRVADAEEQIRQATLKGISKVQEAAELLKGKVETVGKEVASTEEAK
jgi:hypothetical protein